VETCSASGSVGGDATIHMRFGIPPGAAQISLKSLTIHEEAGHYPDTVATEGSVYLNNGYPCVACGDPTTGDFQYWDYTWLTPELHNGPHDLTAVVEVQWQGAYPNPPPPPTDYTAAITVDVENLLITSTVPNNPKPILWDPSTMTSTPVTANISCCYKMNQPWTLQIYDSGQTKVKKYTGNQVIGPGSTAVTVKWDGTSDNTMLYPNGIAPMAKGVYIFQWTVGTPGGTGQDYDQDKSALLSIPQTDSYITDYDPSTDLNSINDSCVLTDGGNPIESAAQVQDTIYYPDLTVAVGPLTLPTTTNPPGDTSPAQDEAQSTISISQAGGYTHLFAAQDDHAAQDKGHRQRWALQKNKKPQHNRADDFDEVANVAPYADTDAQRWQKKVIVGTLPSGAYRFGAYAAFAKGTQSWDTVLQALENDALVLVDCHAAPGNIDCVSDPNGPPLATLYAQNDPAGHNIAGNNLAKLRVVVFLGCETGVTDTGTSNNGNLLSVSVTAGAGCAVGFLQEIQLTYVYGDAKEELSPSRVWSEAFWRAMAIGESVYGYPGTPDTVHNAYLYAQDQVKADTRSGGTYCGYDTVTDQGDDSLTIDIPLR